MSIFVRKLPLSIKYPDSTGWVYVLVVNGIECTKGYDRNAMLDLLEDA